MALRKRDLKPTDCPYCTGKGYFQLPLGGSETCDNCHGSGQKRTKR